MLNKPQAPHIASLSPELIARADEKWNLKRSEVSGDGWVGKDIVEEIKDELADLHNYFCQWLEDDPKKSDIVTTGLALVHNIFRSLPRKAKD